MSSPKGHTEDSEALAPKTSVPLEENAHTPKEVPNTDEDEIEETIFLTDFAKCGIFARIQIKTHEDMCDHAMPYHEYTMPGLNPPAPPSFPEGFTHLHSSNFGSILSSDVHHFQDHAQKILEWAACKVAPIMEKRGWKTLVLREIYTPSGKYGDHRNNLPWVGFHKALQNGEAQEFPLISREIGVRLRSIVYYPFFVSYVQIIDTMLHELAHWKFTKHNGDFWAFVHELRMEYVSLYSGFPLCNGLPV